MKLIIIQIQQVPVATPSLCFVTVTQVFHIKANIIVSALVLFVDTFELWLNVKMCFIMWHVHFVLTGSLSNTSVSRTVHFCWWTICSVHFSQTILSSAHLRELFSSYSFLISVVTYRSMIHISPTYLLVSILCWINTTWVGPERLMRQKHNWSINKTVDSNPYSTRGHTH